MVAPVEVLERPTTPAITHRGTKRPRPALFILAAAIAGAVLLPAIYLTIRGLGFGGDALREHLLNANTAWLLLRTAGLCAAVTATAIAISLPFAWLTVRTDVPGRRVWVVLSALPLVIPSFVGGYTFVAAFGPRGLLQGWLEPIGVDRLPAIYGFPGAWLVLSLFTYPLALLPIRTALAGIDRSIEEASRALGRTRLQTLFTVTLPQLRPAITSGALLVALYTASDFGAVSLLKFRSITFEIHLAYRTFNYEGAAIFGLLLAMFTTLVLVAELRTRGRAVYHASHRGVRRRARMTQLGSWRWPAMAFCVTIVGLALVVPLSVIGIWLVRALSTGTEMSIALINGVHSLQASLLGAAVVVLCALPIAAISARYKDRVTQAIDAASYVGYALPGIVIALSLVFFAVRTPLYQTLVLLIFAYVVHFLPQATGTLRSSIGQIHPGLNEAARSLGASPRDVLRRVTWPLVRPGVTTASALVFLTVMKELPLTLMLGPIEFGTLATQVWGAASAAKFGVAALPALALVALSSVPMALFVAREQRQATS